MDLFPIFSLFRPIMLEDAAARHHAATDVHPLPRHLGFPEWLPKRFFGHSDFQSDLQTCFTSVRISRGAVGTVFRSFGFPEWRPKGFRSSSDFQSGCRSDFSWPRMFRKGPGTMSQPFGISDILQYCFMAAMLVNQYHVAQLTLQFGFGVWNSHTWILPSYAVAKPHFCCPATA